jgi:transposase
MSRARVAVLQVVSDQLSVTAAAAEYGFSRRHLHRLLARYRASGLDAVEPRSRRPRGSSRATPPEVRQRVLQLRLQLTADGLDAGPETIRWHLEQEQLRVLSTSTIRRILHQAGLIVPEPRKRPRSSYIRFQAAQPNEMWQSDFIHWRLADGTDVEILNWLDDHSRYLLSCSAHQPVTGDTVVSVFLDTVAEHGPPASTLTDNGSVYTSRFTGGRNAFEYLLPLLGIQQKNGSPPATPRHRARPSASTRPSNVGSEPGHPPPASPSCNASSMNSERTTTRNARTARSLGAHQARSTGPHRRHSQPATATHKATTGCATTDSTTTAK